jgi:lipopolysaccharide/colanic/teichoic acid biosynthesis glycosyltransferase
VEQLQTQYAGRAEPMLRVETVHEAETPFGTGTWTPPASRVPLQRAPEPGTLCDVPGPWIEPGRLERVFEIGFAIVALILTAPLMLVIAWIIKRDSPGPALFVQSRVGLGGKPFRFVKFRTLYADARTRFPELYRYQYSPGDLAELKFKIVDDPRVTPVGRWLRKTSLDELPNFWNVLTGDMALVGPRPEIPEMVPYYRGEMLRKFSVRPGVTGLAQVSGRGRLKFNDTVAYDLDYIERRSFAFDVRVLLKTVRMMLLGDGAF